MLTRNHLRAIALLSPLLFPLGMFYGFSMVLLRGGEGLQRGPYSTLLANLYVNQKPALCSRRCGQLEFDTERLQTSHSFRWCSSERRAFPWLQGEILSLAAPRSGERRRNNLLCPRALRCWLRSGSSRCHLSLSLRDRRRRMRSVSQSIFLQKESLVGSAPHPWGLHPWEGLGAAVTTSWHRGPVQGSRSPGWPREGKKPTAAWWGVPSHALSASLGLAGVVSCVPRWNTSLRGNCSSCKEIPVIQEDGASVRGCSSAGDRGRGGSVPPAPRAGQRGAGDPEPAPAICCSGCTRRVFFSKLKFSLQEFSRPGE